MATPLDYRSPQIGRAKNPPTSHQRLGFRLGCIALCTIVLALGLDVLWANRVDPNGGTDALAVDLLFALCGFGAILALSILWIFRLRMYREAWRTRAACAIPILLPPFFMILTAWLNHQEVPFRWAFNDSRPALERAAAEIRRDPAVKFSSQTVGILPIKELKIDGPDVIVVIVGSENFDTNPYLIWKADGSAPAVSAYGVKPLGHGWFWVNR